MAVLGIDIGTSGSRALVVDDTGAIVASATSPHAPFRSPGPAWAEQDAEDWWRAAQEAVRAVLAQSRVAPRDIAAIGLSGQMHGAVLLDEAGAVLRPSIIWCDQRTAEECRWLDREIGPARLRHNLQLHRMHAGGKAHGRVIADFSAGAMRTALQPQPRELPCAECGDGHAHTQVDATKVGGVEFRAQPAGDAAQQ